MYSEAVLDSLAVAMQHQYHLNLIVLICFSLVVTAMAGTTMFIFLSIIKRYPKILIGPVTDKEDE